MKPAKRPTVMVADNHGDTRFLLKFWLEAEGYSVMEAADGREAFELTAGECPDLLMISMSMPVLDGFEATRRIRARGRKCVFPIVAMSTYPTAEQRALALAAGCNEFVPLPTPLHDLSRLVGHLIPGPAVEQPRAIS